MGSHKRFNDDDEEAGAEQRPVVSARSGPSAAISKNRKKERRPESGKRPSTKSIRGKIRSIQRLLNHKGAELKPAARKVKEEELKELFRLRDEHDRREVEREMAKKYRMVKFFERRKLQRTLDVIVTKGDKQHDLAKKKQILRDLRYINEYPKDKKYIALFPSGGHTEESRKRVEEMRAEIEAKSHEMGAEHTPAAALDAQVESLGPSREDDFFLDDGNE